MVDEMQRYTMNTPKKTLERVDEIVQNNRVRFGSRTHFINNAIQLLIEKENQR